MTSDDGAAGDRSPPVRISLITSVLNGEPQLGELLASIPAGLPIEHLAIDAGSTDGTVERLQAELGIQLVSRPGIALYAAWNLAIELAKGEAVWFVNADDILPPGAVEAVLAALDRYPEADILQGRSAVFSEDHVDTTGRVPLHYPTPGDTLNRLDLVFGAPVINARICRRRLFDPAGPFDTSYKYAADRDWLLRLAFASPPPNCVEIDALVYRYRIHRGSMTLSQDYQRRLTIAAEHRRIAERWQASLSSLGDDRDLLNAWRVRETLVGAAAALRTGNIAAGIGNAWRLCAGLPMSAAFLARARRYRREYIARTDAHPASTD